LDFAAWENPNAQRSAIDPGPGFFWTQRPTSWVQPRGDVTELILWVQRPDEEGQATTLLDDVLRWGDEIAEAAPLLQANIENVGAPPTNLFTLYEEVCGIWRHVNLTPEWGSRWLRSCSRWLWLGPTLLARVDRDAVAAVASVTAVGDHARLVLRDDATLDALEQALAPILPSHEDWLAAVAALGGDLPREAAGARPY
jgi:hypothetical protein